jgi:cell division protein FtsL
MITTLELILLGGLLTMGLLVTMGVHKLGVILTQHLERQEGTSREMLLQLVACAQRLQDIQESLQRIDNS